MRNKRAKQLRRVAYEAAAKKYNPASRYERSNFEVLRAWLYRRMKISWTRTRKISF